MGKWGWFCHGWSAAGVGLMAGVGGIVSLGGDPKTAPRELAQSMVFP